MTHMQTRRLQSVAFSVVGALLLSLGFAAFTAQPAAAETLHTYTIINKKTVNRYIDRSQRLASCSVGKTGQSCVISRGKTATRTMQLDFGMTRGALASKLGWSSGTSVTMNVQCNSGPMKAGQIFRAYPVGTRVSYQIKDTYIFYTSGSVGAVPKTQTSGTKYAFNPNSKDMHCE